MNQTKKDAAARVLQSTQRIESSRHSAEQSRRILDKTRERVFSSQTRVARANVDLERFQTLGCSTVSQQAYRRSRAAAMALRAIEKAFWTGDRGDEHSDKIWSFENGEEGLTDITIG